MTCPKCNAQMFAEPSLHYQGGAECLVDLGTVGPSVHCLLCGTYLEAVILANRARQADERRLLAQAETIAVCAAYHLPAVWPEPAQRGQ